MNNFNELTPAETERLAILSEECGEVIQIIGKILRYGYESCNPEGFHPPNRNLLIQELGDVFSIINLMNLKGDITYSKIEKAAIERTRFIQKYLHHQEQS